MASGDRTIAFTEEQLEDLSETFETVLEKRNMNPSYSERIPNEIIEKILLDVPTFALPLNVPWVCKTWTSVIMTPQFWVNKLKHHGLNIEDEVWAVLQAFDNDEKVYCLYYASLYQEYRSKNTLISDFFLNVPKPGTSGNWFIFDDHKNAMFMASGVLVCREFREMNNMMILCLDKRANITGLSPLLMLSKAREIKLQLKDNYGFWNFYPRMNSLQILKEAEGKRQILDHFTGCLTTLVGLPIDPYELRLAISVDDKNVAIDPGFSNVSHSSGMWLHLKAGTDISSLPKISSDHEDIRLVVSEMEESHILWMIEVAKKLLIKVHALCFFKFHLNFELTKYLFAALCESGLSIGGGICLSSSTMGHKDKQQLREVVNNFWGGYERVCFYFFNSDKALLEHVQYEYATLVFYCR